MSKYIVSSLSKYSEHDNEIPMVDKIVTFSKKPTLEEAMTALDEFAYFEKDEWTAIDDGTWETCNDCWENVGDPTYYQIKIQTPKQHKEMVNNWIEYIKLNTTPKEVANAAN